MRLLHPGHATGKQNHFQGWSNLPAASLKSTRSTTNTGLILEHSGPEEKCCCEPALQICPRWEHGGWGLEATELVQCTGLRLSPGRTTLPPISQAQPGLGRILTPDPNSSIYDEAAAMIQMQFCLATNDAHFPATCAIYLISRFLPQIYPFSKLNKLASFGDICLNYIYIYYINLEHLKWFFKIYLHLHANHWFYLIRNT